LRFGEIVAFGVGWRGGFSAPVTRKCDQGQQEKYVSENFEKAVHNDKSQNCPICLEAGDALAVTHWRNTPPHPSEEKNRTGLNLSLPVHFERERDISDVNAHYVCRTPKISHCVRDDM